MAALSETSSQCTAGNFDGGVRRAAGRGSDAEQVMYVARFRYAVHIACFSGGA
jgi:hypothetical protein